MTVCIAPMTCSGLNFPPFPGIPSRHPQGTTTMTVRAGREFLAIPGPTTMPDEVLRAMHRPALDIYSDQMIEHDRQPAGRSLANCSPPRATPTSTSPTATAPGKPRSATCCRAATRCWCWKAAGLRSAGAMPRPRWAPRSKCSRATGAARSGRPKSRPGCGRTRITPSRRSWRCRSIPPRARSTTSKPSARRSRRRATPRCSWSMPWPRSAACRSRWMPGASTSRCPDRRRA